MKYLKLVSETIPPTLGVEVIHPVDTSVKLTTVMDCFERAVEPVFAKATAYIVSTSEDTLLLEQLVRHYASICEGDCVPESGQNPRRTFATTKTIPERNRPILITSMIFEW